MTLARRIIFYYLPVLAWCVFIFLLSSQSKLPGPDSSILDFVFKKSAHMFVYGVLYWLLFRASTIGKAKKSEHAYLLPFFLCVLYSATDELHQSLTPGRTPTVRDIGYDMLGMVIVAMKLKGFI